MMARVYDTRPGLETYDALTARRLAKFAAIAALLIGAGIAAERFGFGQWAKASVQLIWIAVGARLLWTGYKSFRFGDPLPHELEPRYAQSQLRFIAPRTAAAIEFGSGLAVILAAAFQIFIAVQE